MGQRAARNSARIFFIRLLCAAIVGAILAVGVSCEPAPSATPRGAKKPTVASLVPAATDLLIGMGAADHLVAVSNWDPDRPEIAGLPKVGDYRTIDWEKILVVRPDVMIVQFRADKAPAGLKDRAAELNIRLVNVTINTLDDLFVTLKQLGDAVNEPAKAGEAEKALRDRLNAVKRRVEGQPRVRTLITRAEPSRALASVGGGNYLDELLTIAGGENVLAGGDNSYPTIDREKLIALDPQAVIALLPGSSPQVVGQAREFWRSIDVSAARDGRVYFLTDSYLLLPGFSVAKVAETFADRLHPTTDESK